MNNYMYTEEPNTETILNDQVILEGKITQKQPTFGGKMKGLPAAPNENDRNDRKRPV